MKCSSKTLIFAFSVFLFCIGYVLLTGQYKFPEENDYFYVRINLNGTIFETDEKFLSVGLDTSFMGCSFHKLNDSNWERLKELSGLLSPGYLRLGGTAADRVVFRVGGTETSLNGSDEYCRNNISNDGFLTITGKDWLKINNFAKDSKLNFIFDLNVLLRSSSGWNSSNAQTLLDFSAENGFHLDFQLGNEPNSFMHVFNTSVSPTELAKDFDTLKKLLNSYRIYKSSKLVGPDVTRPKLKVQVPSLDYLREFLSNTNQIDAASWHQYYLNGRSASLEDFIDPKTFDLLPTQINAVVKVVREFSSDLPIWISETSSAYGGGAPGLSDRFAASFLWLDKLGVSARLGISVAIRQSLLNGNYALIDSDFSPSPDFWISFFYKNLVGNRVLNVTYGESNNNLNYLRFYGHCSNSNLTGSGKVVVFGMNLSNRTENVVVSGLKVDYPIQSFIFTAENKNLTSKSVFLNGKKLVYDGNTIGELLRNSMKVKFPLVLPGHSIAFWIFQGMTENLCD